MWIQRHSGAAQATATTDHPSCSKHHGVPVEASQPIPTYVTTLVRTSASLCSGTDDDVESSALPQPSWRWWRRWGWCGEEAVPPVSPPPRSCPRRAAFFRDEEDAALFKASGASTATAAAAAAAAEDEEDDDDEPDRFGPAVDRFRNDEAVAWFGDAAAAAAAAVAPVAVVDEVLWANATASASVEGETAESSTREGRSRIEGTGLSERCGEYDSSAR